MNVARDTTALQLILGRWFVPETGRVETLRFHRPVLPLPVMLFWCGNLFGYTWLVILSRPTGTVGMP